MGHDQLPAKTPYYYYQANPAKCKLWRGLFKMFNNGLKRIERAKNVTDAGTIRRCSASRARPAVTPTRNPSSRAQQPKQSSAPVHKAQCQAQQAVDAAYQRHAADAAQQTYQQANTHRTNDAEQHEQNDLHQRQEKRLQQCGDFFWQLVACGLAARRPTGKCAGFPVKVQPSASAAASPRPTSVNGLVHL